MPQDRQSIVAKQSQFYQNNFRRLVTFIFFLLCVVCALLGLIVFQEMTRPMPQFFVTTSDGRLVEVKPINP